jgi:hypothetical protein
MHRNHACYTHLVDVECILGTQKRTAGRTDGQMVGRGVAGGRTDGRTRGRTVGWGKGRGGGRPDLRAWLAMHRKWQTHWDVSFWDMCRKANRGNLNLEYSDDWPVSGQFKLRFSRRSFSQPFTPKCLWMWGATGKEASHKVCLRRTACHSGGGCAQDPPKHSWTCPRGCQGAGRPHPHGLRAASP